MKTVEGTHMAIVTIAKEEVVIQLDHTKAGQVSIAVHEGELHSWSTIQVTLTKHNGDRRTIALHARTLVPLTADQAWMLDIK